LSKTGRVASQNDISRTELSNPVAAIRATLEAAGIEFIAEGDGSPGVRMRKADQ
jgi:hypothetical protein